MLKRTKDRKVTNAVTKGGNPAIANSFGLPAGREYSCPNATAFCERICYAGKLEKVYKGVKAVLMHNWDMLKDADYDTMVTLLDSMISDFVAECDKRNAPKAFRIHWDGDFFNTDYVKAWCVVIAKYSAVTFWVYTRVPFAASYLFLQDLDNLSLYFSGDPDNIAVAKILQSQGINIAYVDSTFSDGKEAIPGATKCPENNKALPLISDKGSACAVCGLCVNGRKDVLFSTSKR